MKDPEIIEGELLVGKESRSARTSSQREAPTLTGACPEARPLVMLDPRVG